MTDKPHIDEVDVTKLEDVRAKACTAFYNEMARGFPEIEAGDIDPLAVGRFEYAAMDFIAAWLIANTRTEE